MTTPATERLSVLIEHLLKQAQIADQMNARDKAHKSLENNNLFSAELFTGQSDCFIPYVKEVKHKLSEFSRLTINNKTELSKLTLLQIEQQISALINAMQANQAMHKTAQRSNDAKSKVRLKSNKIRQSLKHKELAKKIMLTSHQLYQKLNEHHEFERRLIDMVAAREQQLSQCKTRDNKKISAEVLALYQRLGRCRKAISTIERDIELAEKRK